MWRARLESKLRTLFRKSTDSPVESRILPEVINCPLTGMLSGQRNLVWHFRNVCKKSVSVNPLCALVRGAASSDVIILTTGCILSVQSIATQVSDISQFSCVFQGEEGQGCCTSQLLHSRVLCHCHPISLGRRGEDFYQGAFIVDVKLSRLSNILPETRSDTAARGALNRCQHFLHSGDRVVLRGI